MTEAIRRLAVIAYHSSPLVEPGAGDAGGMSVYVRELARAFAARGVATDIFTRATGPPHVSAVDRDVRVVAVQAGPPLELPKEELTGHIDAFAAGVRAFAEAESPRYDIVHSHYWQSGLAAQQLRAAWGVPWVHSQHTLARVKNESLAPGEAPESSVRVAGEDAVMASADVLIASTDDEWRQLSCLYTVAHDRLAVVHPGVDHDVFRPGDRAAARARFGLDDEAMILCAGRILPLKGLDLAVRAIGLLAERLERRAVLFVAGGARGPAGAREMARLKALARELDVSHLIRFVGLTRHNDVPELMRAADAVAVCSYSESFGLVALEAHACGTPVVATAVGGLSHIVRDGTTGYLVGTRDPVVFADRLLQVVDDEAIRARFARNAVLAAQRFSWDATAAALLDLYACLVSEGSASLWSVLAGR